MKQTVTFYIGTFFDFFEGRNNFFVTVHSDNIPPNTKILQTIESLSWKDARRAARKLLKGTK
uniref:Uncharacterized protein n=1 Tax=viral metagenome TaxID=1070528 RepID=A0A6H2A2L8_9ZZZZ